jgi:uncharacterized protein YecT (DUF1311 family)
VDLAILLSLLPGAFPADASRAGAIEAEAVRGWSAGSACSPGDVRIETLEHFDFTRDGAPEAVVVASTCGSGTGGPDVHAVLTRDANGRVVELKLPEVDRRSIDVLFGNRNHTLTVRDGLLVATFRDTSGRQAPLVIRYRWNGTSFAVGSISRSRTFRTSYDCGRATKEVERAICHVESLADLDRELARALALSLATAPPTGRDEVRQAQRRWLAARDARCVVYKGWVECLDGAYRERIAELKGISP